MRRLPRLSRQSVLLLDELLRNPSAQRYGYDLMKSTELSAGTLYPLLARLNDLGWLATSWEQESPAGRPPRHLYRLTADGARGAREALDRAAARGWSITPTREQRA